MKSIGSRYLIVFRFPRFLTMPLPIEEDMVEEARFILKQVIENGSMKGVPEFAPLIKSGLLVRAEYDLQAVQTKGKELNINI
jgi:hypothetical protein